MHKLYHVQYMLLSHLYKKYGIQSVLFVEKRIIVVNHTFFMDVLQI